MMGAGLALPQSGTAFLSVNDADKGQAVIIRASLPAWVSSRGKHSELRAVA